MGAYLSEPVTEKHTDEGENEALKYVATTMQGWRVNQEDAHNCQVDFDGNATLFAVYDGHGGPEVSEYTAKHFPEFLKSTEMWKNGRFGQALENAFIAFDKLLLTDSALEELHRLAGTKKATTSDNEDPEEKRLLVEEACLPLEELLKKYGLEMRVSNAAARGGRTRTARNKGKFISPNLKSKKSRPKTRRGEGDEDETSKPNQMEMEDEEAPNTPPPSPNSANKGKQGVKRDHSGENKSGSEDQEAPEVILSSAADSTLSNGLETLKESSNVEAESTEENGLEPKRFKPESTCEDGDPSPEIDRLNDGIREAAADSSSSESAADLPRREVRRCLSEAPRADASKDPVQSNFLKVPETESGAAAEETESAKLRRGSSPRQRSSKSESEVRILQKEEDEGPITNWKTLGNLGADAANSATGTPETATAASSSDESGQSSGEDEDFQVEAAEEDLSSDDGLDSSSSVDVRDSDEAEEEDEEEEEMEEGEGGELVRPMEEEEDSFPVPTGDSPGVDSGTTACVAVIKDRTLYVANAGDSRCVLCRRGQALDLSQDHKPEDAPERSRIEKAGGKVTADGRVNGGLNLSRAIGDHFYKKNASLPLKDQMISPLPDIQTETLCPDDEFLVLACDGIWNSLSSQEVVDFVRIRLKKKTLKEICEELCDSCLAPNTVGDGTGCDNMTVLIAVFKEPLTSKADGELSNGSV